MLEGDEGGARFFVRNQEASDGDAHHGGAA